MRACTLLQARAVVKIKRKFARDVTLPDKVAKGGSLPGRTLFFSPFNSDLPLPYDENDCLQGYFIHFASNNDQSNKIDK